jgi:hypothetical protein
LGEEGHRLVAAALVRGQACAVLQREMEQCRAAVCRCREVAGAARFWRCGNVP